MKYQLALLQYLLILCCGLVLISSLNFYGVIHFSSTQTSSIVELIEPIPSLKWEKKRERKMNKLAKKQKKIAARKVSKKTRGYHILIGLLLVGLAVILLSMWFQLPLSKGGLLLLGGMGAGIVGAFMVFINGFLILLA